jgi:hypothetical protein
VATGHKGSDQVQTSKYAMLYHVAHEVYLGISFFLLEEILPHRCADAN